ncbi:hypothetical protein OID55_28160 [Streptomyces sp. NBC_00715]|uniref:hypothetical protein n=1 Tax=Streptomyces sp. NBC_00715 TaxID=2975811 RepID=UPI0038630DD9
MPEPHPGASGYAQRLTDWRAQQEAARTAADKVPDDEQDDGDVIALPDHVEWVEF